MKGCLCCSHKKFVVLKMEAVEEQKKTLLHKIQIRDVTLAVLCGIAIYLLRSKELYSMTPVWRHDIGNDDIFDSKYQILPLVTDLEGDGKTEAIILTRNGDIVILLPENQRVKRKTLPQAQIKASKRLPKFLEEDFTQIMVPVAMNTGYLTPYSSEDKRSQVRFYI